MSLSNRLKMMSLIGVLFILVTGIALFGGTLLQGHAASPTRNAIVPQGASSTSTNNCGFWKVVRSTNVPSMNNYLYGSTVLAINGGELVTHVWSVGYYIDGNGHAQTLIEHRHGTTWTVIPSPNPGVNNVLTAVVAVSPTYVWAVGYSYTNDPTQDAQTLIVRWDGTNWNPVPSPNPGSSDTLNAIAQISTLDQFWAVGSSDGKTLVEMWDGTNWNVISSPNPAGNASLTGVTVFSAKNAWAVGYFTDANGVKNTLTEHWTGTAWKVIASPNVAGSDSVLTGTARIYSSTKVWAVGYSSANGTPQTLIELFDGQSWSIVASPNLGNSRLNAVSVVTPNIAWAVGYGTNANGAKQTLVETWNGTNWTIMTSPNVGTGDNVLNGMGRVPGNNAFFAVGNYTDTKHALEQTLIETFCH